MTVLKVVALSTAKVVALGAIVAFSTALPAAANDASASSCLKGYDGPYEVVNSYRGIVLKCGDYSKGIIHIDDGHPISESGRDDVRVERCMNNIIGYGKSAPANSGNTARRITRPSGGWAQIVWDSSSKNVVTMYTSDNNNWKACAAYPN